MQLLFSDPNYIDVKIVERDKQWRFTGMYGEFKWQNKHLTWQRLRDLKAEHDMPWVVMGDLNEILYLHEKEGGNPRPQQYMNAFWCKQSKSVGYVSGNFIKLHNYP